MNFAKQHFDKLLLVFLTVFFTCVALHIMHDQADAAVVNWSLALVSGVLGSLTTLITGAVIKHDSGKDDKPKSD